MLHGCHHAATAATMLQRLPPCCNGCCHALHAHTACNTAGQAALRSAATVAPTHSKSTCSSKCATSCASVIRAAARRCTAVHVACCMLHVACCMLHVACCPDESPRAGALRRVLAGEADRPCLGRRRLRCAAHRHDQLCDTVCSHR